MQKVNTSENGSRKKGKLIMDNYKEELIISYGKILTLTNDYVKLIKQYVEMLKIIRTLHETYPQFLYEITSKEKILEIIKEQ